MLVFSTDIQALRAIAVLLVVAFHVWPTHLTGGYVGVDVFFVISGHLITGHLLREVASTGRVDLPAFYARRARRLLPAASLTLVAVGLATYLWMPVFTWETTAADMAASALYAENWALLRRSVDYLAQGQAPSPLQHFWSLAVEEQFYLGWPLLVAGVAAWRRRWHAVVDDCKAGSFPLPSTVHGPPRFSPPRRRAYALPMVLVCSLSFAAALFYARVDPGTGYFMTHVRLFELGLGGLLAVWVARDGRGPSSTLATAVDDVEGQAPAWSMSFMSRTVAAVAGLTAIGASSSLYSTATPFPGAAALVPVLGTVAVIVAGWQTGGPNAAAATASPVHALARPLAHPWLQYFGEVSYSLYLAHWPAIVVYPFATGRTVDGTLADSVTVLAASWALAHACKWGWEDRFRLAAARTGGDKPRGGSVKTVERARTGPVRAWLRLTPVATTFLATASATASVAVLALWLQWQAEHVQMAAVVDVAPTLDRPGIPATSNLTTTPQRCPLFVPMDTATSTASKPAAPGADIVLAGCSTVNSLSISGARPGVDAAKNDYVLQGHPCIEWKPGGKVFQAERPGCVQASKHASKSSSHIVLVGDSHAQHLWPAFDIVSKRLGFHLSVFSRAGCPPTVTLIQRLNPPKKGGPDFGCRAFVEDAVAWLVRQQPSLVILSAHNLYTTADPNSTTDALEAGVVDTVKRLTEAGISVIGIKGTPTMRYDVPECLAKEVARVANATDLTACSVPRSTGLVESTVPGRHVHPVNAAAALYPFLRLLSLDDILCPRDTCLPIIGNTVVYRDRHHFTATFAKTLASAMEGQLRDAVPYLLESWEGGE